MKQLLLIITSLFVMYTTTHAQTAAQPMVISMHLLDVNSDQHLEQLSAQIPDFAKQGVNLIFLEVDYGFDFKSHPELKQEWAYITVAGARKFTALCKKHGIRIVPEFQSLGHQSWAANNGKLLTHYPELDIAPGAFPGNKDIYCREWDPENPKVYEIIFPMIDEIIDAFQADGLHIGMDEVFLLGHEQSPTTKGKNPAELYAGVVNKFYKRYVKEKGLQLFMWGDRLIDGTKYSYGEWEASMNGTAPAVDMIPKDIIICDWHYELRDDYPSIPMFIEKGFKVLPCSYVKPEAAKALIKYSLRQQNPNMIGHMFTSWNSVPKDSLLLYPAFKQGMEVIRTNKIWDTFIELKSAKPDGTLEIALRCDNPNAVIYYTISNPLVSTQYGPGSDPTLQSKKYTGPFLLTPGYSLIKAVAYISDKPAGEINERSFELHKAIGKHINLINPPSPKYAPKEGNTMFVNGVTATKSFADGQWAGFEGADVFAIIEMETATEISEIDFNCFHSPDSWIHAPEKAEVWISADGIDFTKVADGKIKKNQSVIATSKIKFDKTKATYIKIFIPKMMIPQGFTGEGHPAWIFVDEFIVR